MSSYSNATGPPPGSEPAKKSAKKAKPPVSQRFITTVTPETTEGIELYAVRKVAETSIGNMFIHGEAMTKFAAAAKPATDGVFNNIFMNKADNVFIKRLGIEPAFTILSIKHIIADLVHDFTRPVLDQFATDPDKTITTLITRLLAPYPELVTPEVRAELALFYTSCTTDAAAKNRFKEALEKYLAINNLTNITEFLTDEYPTAEGENPGDIDFRTMFEHMYTKYDQNGAGLLFWYLDAQFGNVIDNYFKWRTANHPGGASNSYCRDLAYITDPASGLNTKNYTHIIRNDPVTMLGKYTVMGLDGALAPVPGNSDAVSLAFGERQPIILEERANSVNQTYADLTDNYGKGSTYDLDTRLDKILAKSGGDRFQGYSANSLLWPEKPIIVTNDILASYYYIFFMNCPVLVTGQDVFKLYEFGGAVSNTMTDTQSTRLIDDILGTAGSTTADKIRMYRDSRVNESITQVEYYLTTAITTISNGRIFKFRKMAAATIQPGPGIVYDDKEHAFSISSDTTTFVAAGIKASKLTAAVTSAIIDLLEKCNIYERMVNKQNNIGDITPDPNLIVKKLAGDISELAFPSKYKPLLTVDGPGLSNVNMRKYMEVFSVYSEHVSYSKLSLLFSILETDLPNDGVIKIIYEELVDIFKGRVTNNTVPINIISMLITLIIYDVTRPTLPVRQSSRGPSVGENAVDIERRKTFINNVTSNTIIKAFLFGLIPDELRLTYGGVSYRITGVDNTGSAILQKIQDVGGKISDIGGATVTVTKEEISTNASIDGFLFEFNKIQGTTNLDQFTKFIGSLISTCFQSVAIEGFTRANGVPRFRILKAGFDQSSGKQIIDTILNPLEGAAEAYRKNKKEIEEESKMLDDALRGRIEKEVTMYKLRKGAGKKTPGVKNVLSKAAKKAAGKQQGKRPVNPKLALQRAMLQTDDMMSGKTVGGGSNFNSGKELLEIDTALATNSSDIKTLFRCIYIAFIAGIQIDDREAIGKLYALAALGDFISVLDQDDINKYYQAFLKLNNDMYIDNIDESCIYRMDELYMNTSDIFTAAYDAGTLKLEEGELMDDDELQGYIDELEGIRLQLVINNPDSKPRNIMAAAANLRALVQTEETDQLPGSIKATKFPLGGLPLSQRTKTIFNITQPATSDPGIVTVTPSVSTKVGGRRKTQRRRHSRRKSSRRTQSCPRKTHRRSRRDKE